MVANVVWYIEIEASKLPQNLILNVTQLYGWWALDKYGFQACAD